MDKNNSDKNVLVGKPVSRRDFLKTTAVASAAFTIIPSVAMGRRLGHQAPSDTLNVALIGAGRQGSGDIRNVCKVEVEPEGQVRRGGGMLGVTYRPGTENLVAICDVDWGYSSVLDTAKRYPSAKKYKDWRVMFDEMGKSIDAVLVATPDHTHANPAAVAMTLGKHVYCEKPLTHSIYESRLLGKLAKKYGVATQMGNQGASIDGVRKACAWAWAGEIGEVRKVDVWTNRPVWPQGLDTPTKVQKVPDTLDWNLFLAHMPFRPYNATYTPWNWRGWWDFGTGAFGDMACHNMHPAFKVLKLGYPISIQGQSTMLKKDACPHAQIARMIFPARPNLPKMAMPEVEVTWYDGGFHAMIPEVLPEGRTWDEDGCAIYGTKDTIVLSSHGRNAYLLSGRWPKSPEVLRVVPEDNHYLDWVSACKNPDLRDKTASHFAEAAYFNEMVLMGVLGVRMQKLNKILEWDGQNMQFTNISDSEYMEAYVDPDNIYRAGPRPIPDPNKEHVVNAKEYVAKLVKHDYLNGYKLPDMPA
jgi:predicted dehydrogenase